MYRFAITDSQWDVIKDHMPGREGTQGVTAKDNRLFFDALVYMARVGCPWRDLPARFGKWNSVFKRYDRWVKSGVLNMILDLLTRESDFEWVMVDSSVIRAHLSAAGAKGGKRLRRWDDPRRLQHQDPTCGRFVRQSRSSRTDGRRSS